MFLKAFVLINRLFFLLQSFIIKHLNNWNTTKNFHYYLPAQKTSTL